jgi:uncharacterized membrane protein YphA (DoxX/SURF4 family)
VLGANTVKKPRRKRATGETPPAGTQRPARVDLREPSWFSPESIVRIELLRVLAPLAILGFLSSRIPYTEQWLSEGGFCLPDLGAGDAHESAYLPAVSPTVAWWISAALVISGLLVVVGYKTRRSAAAFAALLVYVALADRLAAFTVSRIAPMLALVICLSPAGARFSLDAWLARRGAADDARAPPVEEMSGGAIRFLQAFLIVFYTASGICKARGDWLNHSAVLWTHLHDSYQTAFTLLLANTLPGFMWTVFQVMTLSFECFALLWLGWRRLRHIGLLFALGMHTLIGLMFGPVIWFSLLMITVNLTCYLPERLLERLGEKLAARTGL